MKEKTKFINANRRGFLKGAAVAGGTAAAGAAIADQGIDQAADAPVLTPTESKGYHETALVREYYKKARF
ncbi:MAG: twin-arginine translocation signal domain-containing protein [Granulosicoccus sp.]